MKYLGKGILVLVSLYFLVLGFVYFDVYEKRPLISLFKLLQSNSSLEIIDHSIDDRNNNDQLFHQMKIEILIMETCMFILNTHLMLIFLA